jgi:exodeoxyribonuclease VII small subunit
MKTDQKTYRQAMADLADIVKRLRDSEDVDVDELVTDVARAKELIDFCNGKIKKADAAIKGIVTELQADRDDPAAVAAEPQEFRNDDGADIPF